MYMFISDIQRIVLYETRARFYLIGSNNTQTKFRVLKIDRTQIDDLELTVDEHEYTTEEIKDLLSMLDHDSKMKVGQKGISGISRTISAFGILGFVKFLEGYYIILITKRLRVGLIGHHTIYKIEETSMIYIPNDTIRSQHPDEARYVKMFQNVDLSSNFYFSYSYDLTHTLQYNMTSPKEFKSGSSEQNPNEGTPGKDREVLGLVTKPYRKFTWNWHLLKPTLKTLPTEWKLFIIHGYLAQSNISLYGKPIYITLIARRSSRYAGTRFLKRGATVYGDVANEVETEQIVFDASLSSLDSGHFSSFVQTRGSIPFFWSQGISKMVPKPPIIMDRADPFCSSAGRHFNQLLYRHGSPIIVLNLVKKREKKQHEGILSAEFNTTIEYLNQFLPPQHRIIHIGFDMARANKAKESNVLARLSDIAYDSVIKTGIFHTRGPLFCHELRPDFRWKELRGVHDGRFLKQTGVVRVNCVDCLDRTNTAQFAVGKVALAYQLYALGCLESPVLQFDSDCVRMLEALYEDHGDTLALQYGGSQLVHRIKTYRKTAPWTSQSRDIVHTLSRYCSNTFSDADKQNAINVFLGIFCPEREKPAIWELTSDYYLHHSILTDDEDDDVDNGEHSLTRWWDRGVLNYLPLPCEQEQKSLEKHVKVFPLASSDQRIDTYFEYYRPFEFSVMFELFAYTMSHSVRDFMPNFTTDFSPFTVRVRPDKRREELGGSNTTTNPSMIGQSSSTSSTSSSADSSSSDDGSDFEPLDLPIGWSSEKDSKTDVPASGHVPLTFAHILPGMKAVYGVEPKTPSQQDFYIYKRYASFGRCLLPPERSVTSKPDSRGVHLIQSSTFPLDDSYCVAPPTVNRKSQGIYTTYAQRGMVGASLPYHCELLIYQNYITKKYR